MATLPAPPPPPPEWVPLWCSPQLHESSSISPLCLWSADSPSMPSIFRKKSTCAIVNLLRHFGDQAHGSGKRLELEMRPQPGDGFVPAGLSLDLADFDPRVGERCAGFGLVAGVFWVGDDVVHDPGVQPLLAVADFHER